MEPADVVLRFLESVGRRSEAEFYINLFRAEPKEQFAAIGVDANVARHATEAVVLHLRFLAALGLAPVVVLGHFEPTDSLEHGARIQRRLGRAGVPGELVAAVRVPGVPAGWRSTYLKFTTRSSEDRPAAGVATLSKSCTTSISVRPRQRDWIASFRATMNRPINFASVCNALPVGCPILACRHSTTTNCGSYFRS